MSFSSEEIRNVSSTVCVDRNKSPEKGPLNDSDLFLRMRSGDVEALSMLYDRFSRLLFSVAYSILSSRAEAEDVIQDTFVYVWQHASDFNPTLGSAQTWLAMIARGRAIDQLRRRSRQTKLTESEFHSPPLSASSARDSLELAERRNSVLQALGELSAGEQLLIKLAFLKGSSHVEISEHCGVPIGTVKARIRRGLLKLRTMLLPSCSLNESVRSKGEDPLQAESSSPRSKLGKPQQTNEPSKFSSFSFRQVA